MYSSFLRHYSSSSSVPVRPQGMLIHSWVNIFGDFMILFSWSYIVNNPWSSWTVIDFYFVLTVGQHGRRESAPATVRCLEWNSILPLNIDVEHQKREVKTRMKRKYNSKKAKQDALFTVLWKKKFLKFAVCSNREENFLWRNCF